MAIEPWLGYVRQRQDILEKLTFKFGVSVLAETILENLSLTQGQILILFRILATDKSEWSAEQNKFIADNQLETALTYIYEKVKEHPEQYSPQNFDSYIETTLKELEKDNSNGK